MSTKEIKQLQPDYFTLHYAGQLVGYATTEAEGKTRLDEIAYDAERGKPVLRLVERDDEDYSDEITPEEYARRSALPIPPQELFDRLLSLPEYQAYGDDVVSHVGKSNCGNPPVACTAFSLDFIHNGGECAYYVPLLYHYEGELWVSTDSQHDLLTDPEHCDIPMRVLGLSPIPYTELMSVVTADEMFIMQRRDVEVQLGPSCRLERQDVERDGIHGWYLKSEGTSWQDGMVELWLPDKLGECDSPTLYFLGNEGVEPTDIEDILPNLLAVLTDPRGVEARKRLTAGLPPFEILGKEAGA